MIAALVWPLSGLCLAIAGLLALRVYAVVARRLRCPHLRVRCTHGDEIIGRGWRRRVCLDCGAALEGPLPEPCTWTGEPHAGVDG